MARSLENINKIRIENGLSPLDKLPEEQVEDSNNKDETAGSSDQLEDDSNNNDQNNKGNGNAKKSKTEDEDVDDERLLQLLQKKGISVASIEDLKPKEDPLIIAEKREARKLSYALQQGKFTKKQYEAYITDSNSLQNIVYQEYYKEAKGEDPEMTDDQINAEFAEKYSLDSDPTSRQYKRGVREIALMGDRLLREKYANIYSADNDFEKFDLEEQKKFENRSLLLSKAPVYKRDVDDVFNEIKKMPVSLSENETYEIDVPEQLLTQIKDMFLDVDFSASQIIKGWTKDDLKEIAMATLKHKHFGAIAHEVAKQYQLKNQAGSKGIVQVGGPERKAVRQLTESQKSILADHGIKEEDLPAAN